MTEFVQAPDGRGIEVLTGGDPDGFPFVFHNGTPTAVMRYEPLWEAAGRTGLHLVTYSRPGYGRSTPRAEESEPDMTDDADDTLVVLDELGLGEYVTLGWSGGGPRALACAARHAPRCRAATSFAGIAPYGAAGLDWFAGMGADNVDGFQLALRGREASRKQAEVDAAEMATVTGDQVVEALGTLVGEVDARALTGEFAEWTAATFRYAFHQGVVGYLDDGLQVTRPWGYDPAAITVPVAVWHGAHDKMAPFGHGRWLAGAIPGARAHLLDDEGHLSLVARLEEMLVELREMAGLGPA